MPHPIDAGGWRGLGGSLEIWAVANVGPTPSRRPRVGREWEKVAQDTLRDRPRFAIVVETESSPNFAFHWRN
jgi:hypothetical protein